MQLSPKSTTKSLMSRFEAEAERRSEFRGNPHFDLCNLLEAVRLREQLQTLTLCDSAGLLVAGAGRYQDCEELSARAAGDDSAVSAKLQVSGSSLLLSAANSNSEFPLPRETAEELSAACQRILERPTKSISALLGS